MMLRPRYLMLSALLALPLYCVSVQAQQANGLQQHMSSTEFKAAGLDKLSPQELGNLDSWLSTHDKTTTRVVDSSGAPVFYPGSSKRSTIDAHIVGHFDGWNKQHEFTLDNGQVWISTDPEAHAYKPVENPEVKIKPSLLGMWMMYVPSCYENVHVKRVR